MNIRTRKLIGVVVTVTYLIVYALIAMAVGGVFAVGRGMLVELVAFITLGLLWIPGAMLIIRWMSRPDVPPT
jgi:Protein of unknown function (DUF2842)